MKKAIRFLTLVMVSVMFLETTAHATTITDLQNQQQATQQELNKVNQNITNLQKQEQKIQKELEALDDELVAVLTDIEVLEGDIEIKEEEIEEAQKAYDAAKKKEEKQYADMKKRIQYTYEKGDVSYVTLLLQARSIADWLNKADFTQQVYEYDRNMLVEYQETKRQVEELQIQLDEEKEELLEIEANLEEEKARLEEVIEEKQEQAENFEDQLADAKKKAKDLKKTLQTQTQQIQNAQPNANNNANAGGSVSVSGGSATGRAIANYALQFVGRPYVYGGTSLTNGIDCSGFTMRVHEHFGISLPRTSAAQARAGKTVPFSQAQPGDVICYSGHVAIYLGGNRIVHASTAKTGVKVSNNAAYRTIKCVKRYY